MAHAACALHPSLCTQLNAVPWPRMQRLAWIGKPVCRALAARAGATMADRQVDALRDVEGL